MTVTSNVTPIRPTNPIPEFRRNTVSELFTTGTLPTAGDFVARVVLQGDSNGGVVISTPAFGAVRAVEVHPESEHPSLTLRFDFGLHVTVTGTAELIWRPRDAA